jgi:mannan polymerase II complex MNN11 subunit
MLLTIDTSGYENFFASTSNYTQYTEPFPSSWTLIPALRHALTRFPHSAHFFSLSPHALIMSPSISLQNHVLKPAKLESLMRKDVPVVPPDSVIHTFSHLKGDKIDLIMTQDAENLSHKSFILRRGEWAKFFLDTWFNPLYRAYNFQKAEGHALVGHYARPKDSQANSVANRSMSFNGILPFLPSLFWYRKES